MDEIAELEEGEGYYFKDGDDDDGASMDPDVPLSCSVRDDKLQDVLGHFRKDFERGVCLGENFEVYSVLGLEELSREPQEGPDESPSSIIQVMTSSPLHGDMLLSPLPDDLIHFTDKERLFRDTKAGSQRAAEKVL